MSECLQGIARSCCLCTTLHYSAVFGCPTLARTIIPTTQDIASKGSLPFLINLGQLCVDLWFSWLWPAPLRSCSQTSSRRSVDFCLWLGATPLSCNDQHTACEHLQCQNSGMKPLTWLGGEQTPDNEHIFIKSVQGWQSSCSLRPSTISQSGSGAWVLMASELLCALSLRAGALQHPDIARWRWLSSAEHSCDLAHKVSSRGDFRPFCGSMSHSDAPEAGQ